MPVRRKRCTSLKLTTMLAGAAGLSVSACDQPAAQWDQASIANRDPVEALAYSTLEACKSANEVPDDACDKAYAAARTDDQTHAPRYDDRTSCEDVYGAGNCVPRGSGGGSFFTPLLAGFVIGRMLDGASGNPYYRGTALYRRHDGAAGGGYYYTPWGGVFDRDYRTGRTVVGRQGIEPPPAIRQAPPKVQTRTAVVSRGGFGGGRSYGFGG